MNLLEKLRARPEWQDDDPTVRASAVREMVVDDDTLPILTEIARTDGDATVRREALRRLDRIDDVLSIGCKDSDETVRTTAAEMLRTFALETESDDDIEEVLSSLAERDLAVVARSARSEAVSLASVSKIKEDRWLGTVARGARSVETAKAALARLQDPGHIREVVMKTEDRAVALLAFDRLTGRLDRDALGVIAKRARQKAAARRARQLLAEFEEATAEPTDQESVDPQPAPELPPVSGTAPADFAAERVAREEQRERRRVALAARRRLCKQVDELDGPDTAARLAELRSEWAALPTVSPDVAPPSVVAELSDRYREAVERCQRRSRQREAEARQAVDREAKERIEQQRRDSQAAALSEEDRQRQENQNRLEQLCQTIEEVVGAEAPARQVAERHLRAARQALEDLQEKRPQAALPSARAHEALGRRLRRAHTALRARVRELRDFDDWQRWANLGVQERLCVELEALSQLADDSELASRYQDIMRQWRQAAELPKGQGEELRLRFQAAHDLVYPRREAYLVIQAEERRRSLEGRLALIEEAERLATSTDWLATAKRITELQAKWKEIGPVPRQHQRETWARFRGACNAFFARRKEDLGKRKEEWTRNLELKRALCARVEALRDVSDLSAALTEVRKAQAEWKTIGPVRRKQSDTVWRAFQTVCDEVYARTRAAEQQAAAEKVAVYEALLGQLGALLSSDPSPEPTATVATAIRDIQQQWRQAPDVPETIRKPLAARLEQALAALVEVHPEAFRGTELDPTRRLRRLEALCKRAETLAGEIQALAGDTEASPAEILAAKLRDALARNTMGAREDETAKKRAALDELRRMQAEKRRLGTLSGREATALTDRFEQASARIVDQVRPKKD